MIRAFHEVGQGLAPVPNPDAEALAEASWVDMFRPDEAEVRALETLGVKVPGLAEMEEIELSNRLYQENGIDYLTVMVPGQDDNGAQIGGPVTFILSTKRLVTVRHHSPRPFETFPLRADKSGLGCKGPERVFLGLMLELVGRLADHLEGVGRALDQVARQIFQPQPRGHTAKALHEALRQIGGEGERLGRVRLALMTIGRALNHIEPVFSTWPGSKDLIKANRAMLRDIDALDVHANYLDSRLALASDATLGTIDLSQNTTIKSVSLVSILFLPPTLIASLYGMNFANMPELSHPWGYPAALGLMLGSAVVTWAVFRWKGWL